MTRPRSALRAAPSRATPQQNSPHCLVADVRHVVSGSAQFRKRRMPQEVGLADLLTAGLRSQQMADRWCTFKQAVDMILQQAISVGYPLVLAQVLQPRFHQERL